MPAKIVMKKFGVLAIPPYFDELDKQDFQKGKSISFKNKLINKTKTHKLKRPFCSASENFRRNWFCKDCVHSFHLKPQRKFKTLLCYVLNCPYCKSANVTHGPQLTIAIRNNMSISEITKSVLHNDYEIEFSLNKKSKYYPLVDS